MSSALVNQLGRAVAYQSKRYTARKFQRRYKKRSMKGMVAMRRNAISTKTIRYMPKTSMQQPLPRCYHTRMVTRLSATYSSTDTLPIRFVIKMNSILTPFNTGNAILNENPDGQTLTPVGLNYLIPNNGVGPYQRFTVLSSYLQIAARGTAAGDIMKMTIIPLDSQGESIFATRTPAQIRTQPLAKTVQTTLNQGRTIKKRQSIASLVGTSRKALMDDLSEQYDGDYQTDPATKYYWGVILEDQVSTLNGTVSIDVLITHNVCLWNQATGIFPIEEIEE